jgi:flagellin-like hook-associated protein FlgL
VTNTIFIAVANNVMRSEDRLLQLQEEVSSGKRLDKLSTNPPDVGQMLRYRTTTASVEQYYRNIDGQSLAGLCRYQPQPSQGCADTG